ncbi:MAG: hypothetical protein OHK0045_02780 [Raineya sp.]
MKSSHKYIIFSLLLANLLIQLFYWGYFRQEIHHIYTVERIEGFWASIIKIFYPRFFVEKHRFDLNFFLQKTEQILWRLALVSVSIAIILVFAKEKINYFFFNSKLIERKKIVFLQIVLTCGWVYESFTWYKSLMRLSQVKDLYEPYLLLRFIPFPEAEALFFWFAIFYLFLLLSFVPRIAPIFWSLSVVLIIILLGFLYGFSKIDHTYATWLYVSMLLPFLLRNETQVDAWALGLMQWLVALVYLQAGLEKILISGWDWFSPSTLRSHLLLHPTAWGLKIADEPFLCVLGSIFMIVLQVGFVSILFFPRLKYFFLPAGAFFHVATYLLMNIGGLISFWYLVYIIYLLGEKNIPQNE